MNIILIGPPGAGKGTQAKRISADFGIPQVSTGDIFRKEMALKSKIGLKVKNIIEAGDFVSDDLVVDIVTQKLKGADCQNGYILDGFPRNLTQAIKLDTQLQTGIDFVIDIKVNDELLIERLSNRRVCPCGESFHLTFRPPQNEGLCDECGTELIHRADDQIETVKHRIEVYHEQTAPIIEYYRKKNLVYEFDGGQHYDEVAELIYGLLYKPIAA